MHWQCTPFADLGVEALYDLLALRSEVFVVEQQCIFQDIDGLDRHTWHLLGRQSDGTLGAYARLIPPGLKGADALIGRVVTAPSARGNGSGRALMTEALAACERLWPGHPLTLHAQAHLQGFYASFGFTPVGDTYMEDGIAHIEMRLPKETHA
ncbi:GNAT family N-acetyltransferase [Roseateles sp. BYS87W]|uniref:GNAT family N-acetyltransferase n=1 Tax=Pelomonas baiyunensis TaxID=3299026 RepID=A0ABW7H3Z2_9BURK